MCIDYRTSADTRVQRCDVEPVGLPRCKAGELNESWSVYCYWIDNLLRDDVPRIADVSEVDPPHRLRWYFFG